MYSQRRAGDNEDYILYSLFVSSLPPCILLSKVLSLDELASVWSVGSAL